MAQPRYGSDQPQYHFQQAHPDYRHSLASQITVETTATRRRRKCQEMLMWLLVMFVAFLLIVGIVALVFILHTNWR